MKPKLILVTAAMVLLAGCSSLPGETAKKAEDHTAHHPPQATVEADAAKVDQQMKMMHDMHMKMQAAKTPQERAALMKEHMKTMQDGMAMMGHMRGGMGMGMGKGMQPGAGGSMKGSHHDMMARRMEMMEMMMQMMMDRDGMKSPPAN